MPIVAAGDASMPTHRSYRMSRDLQVWLVKGRDSRSPNPMADGPGNSPWAETQREWLKRTLLAGDAIFRVLVTPSPIIGPDDAHRRDNHANIGGFRHEVEAFPDWLHENGIDPGRLPIAPGDHYWQYHSIHPYGFQEYSSAVLDDADARVSKPPGYPDSTDPQATITQPCVHDSVDDVSGAFLLLKVNSENASSLLSIHLPRRNGNGSLPARCHE